MSTAKDPNHPMWSVVKQITSATIITVCCSLIYTSGFVPKDISLLVANAAGLLLVDFIKKQYTLVSDVER